MNADDDGRLGGGSDERSWETAGDDEMFLVEVVELALEEHQVGFGCLEFVRGGNEEQFRQHLLHALSGVVGVHDVGWEDREVALVKGAHEGAALLGAAVAVLEQHRVWLERRG